MKSNKYIAVIAAVIFGFACSTKAEKPIDSKPAAAASDTSAKAPSAAAPTQAVASLTAAAVAAAPAKDSAAKPTAKTEPFAAAPYRIRIVSSEATAGAPTSTRIEITPLDGYKMNKDFPSRLRVDVTDKATTPKTDFQQGDAEITEERLGFKVGLTPKAAGAINMTGTTDFSVCNESTCKLYRGEKLAWELAVK